MNTTRVPTRGFTLRFYFRVPQRVHYRQDRDHENEIRELSKKSKKTRRVLRPKHDPAGHSYLFAYAAGDYEMTAALDVLRRILVSLPECVQLTFELNAA